MPDYEFFCRKCSKQFTAHMSIDEHDRQVAEALLRISPGVSEVLNDVSVQPSASGSGGSQ